MEEINEQLKATREEMDESKRVLELLANEVSALGDVIRPALHEQLRTLRESRMAVTLEVQASLTALRDVRKFFLESDYQIEMDRLERFVRICRELQSLKQEGFLDVVADVALRLAERVSP